MRLREPMPELVGATTWLNGHATKEKLVGENPTLIHFWSVSCYMCKESMPVVNQFHDKYRGELNVVSVHIPRSKADLDLDRIKSSAEKYDIKHPVFVDNTLKLMDAFGNKEVPAYYVFDKDGKLRHYQIGGSGVKMLKMRINRLLGKMN